MFSARINTRQLASLCRRLATSLESGLDIRRVLAREAESRGNAALRARLSEVESAVARGTNLHDAMAATGEYFPPLFREMIAVGEATGKLPEILRHLAEHYEHQIVVRRAFMIALAWPAFQLGATICIIGFLIWVLGAIGRYTGSQPTDILGLGLVGNRGLLIYALFIGSLAGAAVLVYQAIRRGWLWGRLVERVLLRVPFVGGALRALSMERLAWSLHLTMDSGMEIKRALSLSLRSAQNGVFVDTIPDITRDVASGRSITEAFERTRAFPDDFLQTLDVAERSGRIPESMLHLAGQYQGRARTAITALSAVLWFLIWAAIAAVIIALIFRLAFFYIGTIQELSKPI